MGGGGMKMKPEYWVLSLSGGKDSTALGLEWLTRHRADPATYPLDEVIYCDILICGTGYWTWNTAHGGLSKIAIQ